ncbi:MAG: nuclear transport factor 2 family protein [Thermonemataceae bacterium]
MNPFEEKNEQLNTLLTQGQAMEAFERFYAEEVTMQENENEPRVGKVLNRQQCGEFVEVFPDLTLKILSTAYGDNLSVQEVLFDYTDHEGKKVIYPEVAVRHWKDGMIIKEKFYYAS